MAALLARPSAGLSLQTLSSFTGTRLHHQHAQPMAVSPPATITCMAKKWIKKDTRPNSKLDWKNMHVKVGDTVQVIAGSDKGKVTEVLRIIRHNSMIVCKDTNIKTKHKAPKAEGEKGMITTLEAPMHSSNVALYSKEKKVRSRVGHKVLESGRKVRYLIKTGEVVDKDKV